MNRTDEGGLAWALADSAAALLSQPIAHRCARKSVQESKQARSGTYLPFTQKLRPRFRASWGAGVGLDSRLRGN